MDSKKLPLWLVFKNADRIVQQPIYTMFKAGDDLRQDMLTLQLMKIMEKIWSKASLDLRMNVYGCVSTGLSDGFLEIVQNAETMSKIASVQSDSIRFFSPIKGFLYKFLVDFHNDWSVQFLLRFLQ
ncbi:hypothetical protein L7F22_015484 [Adiantum nelumboides]|nr:hypothetical protein [Adiantum nelumboides]